MNTEPIVVDAKGKPFAPPMAYEVIIKVYRLHGSNLETEWLLNPHQEFAVESTAVSANIATAGDLIMHQSRTLCGRPRHIEYRLMPDVILLREVSTKELVGKIVNLEVPKL